MAKELMIVDQISVDEDGNLIIWACVSNALGLSDERIQDCPAAVGECPRGFRRTFECRKYGVDE